MALNSMYECKIPHDADVVVVQAITRHSRRISYGTYRSGTVEGCRDSAESRIDAVPGHLDSRSFPQGPPRPTGPQDHLDSGSCLLVDGHGGLGRWFHGRVSPGLLGSH